MTKLANVKSPFNEVSIYPPQLPYVGQQRAYDQLQEFMREMERGPESVFCAVYGDWAIGKSRLAHEIIAEVCGEDRDWLLAGKSTRHNQLLKVLHQSGVFPMFVPYARVLNFESFGITSNDVLGKVVTTAFWQLCERQGTNAIQLTIIERLRGVISSLNPDFDFSRLSLMAQDRDEDYVTRSNGLFRSLCSGTMTASKPTIRKLLVLVDEVESAGEINPFSTQTDRAVTDYPVPLRSIRDLTEAIKSESRMTTYPDISFIFFNSQTVKRHTRLEPLSRRQVEVDLERATADDFALLLNALKDTGYPVDDLVTELAHTAFFAADRNIGWFSYIMRRVHYILQEQPELTSPADIFQQVYKGTGKVFRPNHLEDRSIAEPLKNCMRRVIYHQLPATLDELGISEADKRPMTEYRDPFGTRFISEVFLTRISGDSLTAKLLETSRYSAEQKPKLVGEGSSPFDPAAIVKQMHTFGWRNTDAWWVYAEPAEFERQLGFIFGSSLTSQTAATLHKIISASPYRQAQPAALIAPAMGFLLRFNELWGRQASPNWLPEQQWEALLRRIDETPTENEGRLLTGIAKLLYPQVEVLDKRFEAGRKQLILRVDERDLLSVNPERKIALLKASSDPAQTVENLRTLRGMLVLLVFDGDGARDKWIKHLGDTRQRQLVVPVISRVVQPDTREYEFCLRYSFRDETNGFNATDVSLQGQQQREEFKSYWEDQIKRWIVETDNQGYVIRPFIASVTGFKKFLVAFPLLAAGKTRAQLQALDDGKELLAGLNDVKTVQGVDTLPILDSNDCLIYPSLFPRVLALLEQPRKLTELEAELFYVRSSRTDVVFPKTGSQVLDQVLNLLVSVGLVEISEDKKYSAVTEQRLGKEIDEALQQLGAFEAPYSGYAAKVSSLSPSLRQLATSLGINFDMLLSLKASQILPQRNAIPELRMQRLNHTPADQAAFAEVASRINAIRYAARDILNKAQSIPPDIDPETLSSRISEISADKAYAKYSVEYRVKFLDKVSQAFGDRCQGVLKAVETRRGAIQEDGSLSRNEDGSHFPTGPLERILDTVEQDARQELDTTLPASLRIDAADLPLKNRIGAGAIAIAIKKLKWYQDQLADSNQTGWWAQFVSGYNRWQSVLQQHRTLESRWSEIVSYFTGTPSEHRAIFISADLEQDTRQVGAQVKNLVKTLDELEDPKITDVLAEIDSIAGRIAAIETRAEESYKEAQTEIRDLAEQIDVEAVRSLAKRMGQDTTLDNTESILRLRNHQQQHTRLKEYEGEVARVGEDLCKDQNLYARYVEIRAAKRMGADGERIRTDFGLDVLQELDRRKIIRLRYEVEV